MRLRHILWTVALLSSCGTFGAWAQNLTYCAGPPRLPPPKVMATAASAARAWNESIQTVRRCVQPAVIRCVDFAILAACGPDDVETCTYDAFGDGFSRLKLNADGSIPPKARDIMELGENETVSVELAELDGVNVWLLNNISAVTGVRVTVDIFRLPDSIRNSPDRAKQLDFVFNRLEDGGYDCALPSTISSFDRAPLMKFILPNQPFGFLVVSPYPKAISQPPSKRLFAWTRPFSGPLWITLFASLIAVGCAMAWFEHKKNARDFKSHHKTPWKYAVHNAWHGIYTSIAHWPGCNYFMSVTVPGRILNVAYSVFCRLLLATYTAGLASNLVVSRSPARTITSIASFQETGIPACVLNRTSHLDFIRQNYPKLQIRVVPSGASIGVLLDAVQKGTCGGAVSTNVHLEFGIGLGDVDGRFCGLSATGSNLGVGLYAVPFSLRTSDTLIEALSQITTATITDNTYYTRAMSVQFSRNRTQCPPPPLVGKSKSLDLPDTAGIFVIQGVGILAATLLKLWKHLKARQRHKGPAWLWGDPPPPEPAQAKLAAAAKEEQKQETLRAKEERQARAALALLLRAQQQQKELLGRIVEAARDRERVAGEDDATFGGGEPAAGPGAQQLGGHLKARGPLPARRPAGLAAGGGPAGRDGVSPGATMPGRGSALRRPATGHQAAGSS